MSYRQRWCTATLLALGLGMVSLRGEEAVAVAHRVHLVGDSTMTTYGARLHPRCGWGQMLAEKLGGRVDVLNRARPGRSSKSFRDQGHWEAVRAALAPGDYVVIQFGHNDAKSLDPERYTEPGTGYAEQLRAYVAETRGQGAEPILATSICRRSFDETGQWQATHGDYPAAMRRVAAEMNVPLVDLQAKTRTLLEELGPERSLLIYLHIVPGAYASHPEGASDDTHLSEMGAKKIAALFVEGLRELNHPLITPPAVE